MDSSRLKIILFITLASFFALYLGIAAATAQMKALSWIVGGLFLAVCIGLGKHVWILIPATLSMKGGVNFLPGQIPPWVFMTAATGCLFLLRAAIRRQTVFFKWTWMETAIALVALSIVQAIVRNPVGLQALGGDRAGSKPYFIFIFAFAAYYIIVASRPGLKEWKWAVILFATFGIMDGLIQAISGLYPSFAMIMGKIYTNVSYNEAMGQGDGYDLSESRLMFLTQIGSILGLIACSYWRPLSAINLFKPWRALTIGLALICILLSGFRGTMAALFVRFCMGSVIRRHYLDVLVIFLIGILGVTFIAFSGLSKDLPFGIQRVLSALPIPLELSSAARTNAEGSSQDRFDMWKAALTGDRYIQNKVLGDGFQFSAVEVKAMGEAALPDSPLNKLPWIDRALEMGVYHGFHVETIRFTGVVGLFAATLALIIFMRYAWRSIDLLRDTPIWGHVIFMCLPFVIYPFWYWFIFGSYRDGFPELLALAAMVRASYDLGLLHHGVLATEKTSEAGAKFSRMPPMRRPAPQGL